MGQEKEDLFRKVSLERLASPDRLDQLIRVTDPKGWIALIAFLSIIFVAILWSIFGRIPTKVSGFTILLKTGGVLNVVTGVPGRLTDISVSPGDTVIRGNTIARIEQPDLLNKLYLTRTKLRDAEEEKQKSAETRAHLKRDLREKVKHLEERLEAQRELLKEGLVTKQSVIDYEHSVKLEKYNLEKLDLEDLEAQRAVDEQKRTLNTLSEDYESTNRVISPYSGRVLEVKVTDGSVVSAGTAIISMERMGKDVMELEAVIFVPANEGKKIRPGMNINIAPTTIRSEEYGTLLGKVTEVSPFPATSQAIMAILQDEQLVNEILKQGSVVEVRATLIPDPKTISGYKWTSPAGPPIKVQSGSLGTAQITVEQQRPIRLVLPLIKKTIGVYE